MKNLPAKQKKLSKKAQRTKATEEDVWEAVNWWKIKNKWKRPIREDDNKALRMIEKRVKNGHICRSS